MEPNSPAEELPALYRAILDRVASSRRPASGRGGPRPRRRATRPIRAPGTSGPPRLDALLAPARAPDAGERIRARPGRRQRPLRASAAHRRRSPHRDAAPTPLADGGAARRRLRAVTQRRPSLDAAIDARARRVRRARRARRGDRGRVVVRHRTSSDRLARAARRGRRRARRRAGRPGRRRRHRPRDRRDRPDRPIRTARSTGCRPSRRSSCSRWARRREVPGRGPRRARRRVRRHPGRPARRARRRPAGRRDHRPSACWPVP